MQNLSLGNIRFKRNMIRLNICLIIFITVAFMLFSIFQIPILKALCSDNAIFITNDKIHNDTRDFSYYVKDYDDDIKDVFTTVVKKIDIDNIDESDIVLFTPLMQSEAFEIYVNDEKMAIEGDTIDLNSCIWTKSFNYTIDSKIFNKQFNTITIVQYSRYMSGGLSIPFIIDGYHSSACLRNISMFSFHQAIMGVGVALVFFLLLLIILLPKYRKLYLIMIITLVFLVIGYIELYKINSLPFDYLIFKKIMITANLLSVVVVTLLFRYMFCIKKYSNRLTIIYSFIAILCAIFPQDMITYKKIYSIQSLAIIPMFFYWGYLALKNYKKRDEGKVVLALTIAFSIYIICYNISEITKLAYIPSSTVLVLPLFIVLIITLVLSDIYDLNINEALTSIQYKNAYKKSIIDQNTGLYNASYMKQIINVSVHPFTMVIFDIDDFKGINDKYGHVAGDKALKNVACIVKSMLRDDDYMGRYGGDEFILMLNTDDPAIVDKILERIRTTIEEKEFCFNNVCFSFTVSIGYCISQGNESFDKILHKADKALYKAKNNGKNKLCHYDNSRDIV